MGGQKKVKIKHEESGVEKNCFIGYSWTYFFFGFFVPIFRGEISIGVFHLIFSLLTFGVFQIIMPFLYNKHYSTRLLTDGWKLADTEENNDLAKTKVGIA
jgi:vacuolar-type H+-ATPase subunit I/STV1